MTRIAIVTGASSGLGWEFVKRIDADEAGPVDEIWAVARREERLAALERTCNTTVRPFCLDLTDPESFDILDHALAQTPHAAIALLVNNAGFGTFGPLRDQSGQDTRNMIKLLMQAPVELIYRSLPYMEQGSRIINIPGPTETRRVLRCQALHPRHIPLAQCRAQRGGNRRDRSLPKIHEDGIPGQARRYAGSCQYDGHRLRKGRQRCARRAQGRPARTGPLHPIMGHEGVLPRGQGAPLSVRAIRGTRVGYRIGPHWNRLKNAPHD